jgi:dTDP-4-amino-4,6-dideoxygalactose transaminase
MKRPAVLGGPPAFVDELPFARPLRPPLEAVTARLSDSYDRGVLTNGPLVRSLEEHAAERFGAPHVVAVSSCTSGLILTIQALRPQGPVLLPSFTFAASGHAVVWNGLRPLFAECDPNTFQLDIHDAERRLSESGAILATHVFGAPCPATAVEALGRARQIPALFDAAHAFGAFHQGRPVGTFGDAEVFSLSPTKPVVGGEGGLVATPHRELADRLRLARDYGNPGDYDTRFIGLNARMSEFHAALALESLTLLDQHLGMRAAVAERYSAGLAVVPGVEVQQVPAGDTSTFKDFSVTVEPSEFGLTRDVVVRALKSDGIDTRNYFDPPVHRQQSYAGFPAVDLPVTDDLAGRITSLPMFGQLSLDAVDRVVECLIALHAHAEEVADAVSAARATPGT